MTISTETYRVEYAGNSSTTDFSTGFAFLDNDDVFAILRTDSTGVEVAWVESTNYTLVGANTDAAGTLTALVAPATGTTLIIYRDPAVTQPTSFPLGGDFPSGSAEDALDRIVMLIQKVSGDVDGALHYPTSDDTDLSSILPNSTDRASMFLAFDADGEPVAAAGTSADLGPVSAFINTLLDDVDAATARATLGAGTVAIGDANTFTKSQTVSLATAGNNLVLTTTDAGATGSTLRFHHKGGSQADADIVSTILFDGQDDAGTPNDQTYAKLTVTATDSGNGSEDGTLTLFTPVAGTLAARLAIGAGVYAPTATGTDKGVGTMNYTQFYDDGVALPTGMADAAAMETPVSAVLSVPPSLQHRHPGHPKAWLKSDWSSTTPTLNADYGVTSISDDGVGLSTVTVDTAFSAATYGVTGMAGRTAGAANCAVNRLNAGTYTTTAFAVRVFETTAAPAADSPFVALTFFGDQ